MTTRRTVRAKMHNAGVTLAAGFIVALPLLWLAFIVWAVASVVLWLTSK